MYDQETGNRTGFRRPKSHIWTGLFILLIGVAALLRINYPEFPEWIFSWQMLLIALGLFIGLRHGFRGPVWFILIIIGGVFLYPEIYPDVSIRRYIWPVALIAIGLAIIFCPKGRTRWRKLQQNNSSNDPSKSETMKPGLNVTADDFVDSTAIFGGSKKNIISKNFRGGDLVNIFGGTELDLTRADFSGTAEIDLTTIFGGTTFVVPSNWTVKSEAVTIFGGLEDKRNLHNAVDDPTKVLVIKGTVIFGGIELKSY